jgi:hypothetical protein
MPRTKRTTKKSTTRKTKSTTKENSFFESVVKGGKNIFSPPK